MNEQATAIIKSYFEQKPDVVAVYLFGSYAEGRQRHKSDIDIGILLQGSERTGAVDKRIDYMVELSRLLKKDIHPVILNSASEALIRQIFLKGKCILVNDSRELAKYKMMMISRIADFGYYRTMIHSGFVNKVMEG
ncbi:MAG: nucleotidyltransferase domain-containing protein [Desulfobacteraceae bacterium]|jgi:predicted nucleotidyltransferase